MPLKVADSFSTRRSMHIRGYNEDMHFVPTLYYYDSRNKPERTPAQITFHHKVTIYKLHYKNAYSDEKEHMRREIEWERNESETEREKN